MLTQLLYFSIELSSLLLYWIIFTDEDLLVWRYLLLPIYLLLDEITLIGLRMTLILFILSFEAILRLRCNLTFDILIKVRFVVII